MASPRRDHTATLLNDGRVLIIGWTTSNAELFDPRSGTFFAAGNAVYNHGQGHTATLLQDGTVLIAGGSEAEKNAEIFNPVTGIFSTIDTLYFQHAYHTATLFPDGRVLIAGGQKNAPPQTLNKVEVYDPIQKKFSLTDSLRVDRLGHAAVLLPNGKVLIVGGLQTTTPGYGVSLASAEIYDPLDKTFRLTGRMNNYRIGLSATLLGDGSILVAGGCVANTAEVFNIATGQFSLTDTMTTSRSSHTATLMSDGRVLIAGGYVAVGPVTTSSAEIYDPVKRIFTVVGNMNSPRQEHAAVRLSDGRILVTGGSNGSTELCSAEIYTPPPILTSIEDVPHDQGGKVTLYWKAIILDTNTVELPYYSIWRSLSPTISTTQFPLSVPAMNREFNVPAYRTTIFNGQEYAWEWIANQPAHRFTMYSYTAPTLYDSMSTTKGIHYFLVSAQTKDPNVFYDSNIESGYSVDNLSPGTPSHPKISALLSGSMQLSWSKNTTDPDVGGYVIYRSELSGFQLTNKNKLAITTDTVYVDASTSAGHHYYYRITTEDIHGNQSIPTSELSQVALAVEKEITAPKDFALFQNYPNPFNPSTSISYQLPATGFVSLKIFDMLGREVATLVSEMKEPGMYELKWNAAKVPSGVYFYQLKAGTYTQTNKLILAK